MHIDCGKRVERNSGDGIGWKINATDSCFADGGGCKGRLVRLPGKCATFGYGWLFFTFFFSSIYVYISQFVSLT